MANSSIFDPIQIYLYFTSHWTSPACKAFLNKLLIRAIKLHQMSHQCETCFVYRWLSSPTALLYDPALSRMVQRMMKKLYMQVCFFLSKAKGNVTLFLATHRQFLSGLYIIWLIVMFFLFSLWPNSSVLVPLLCLQASAKSLFVLKREGN